MFQRIALYAVLGLVLDAASINIDHWAFWCILALFIASEWMTRREVTEQMEEYISAVREQIARVAHAAEEVKKTFEENKK